MLGYLLLSSKIRDRGVEAKRTRKKGVRGKGLSYIYTLSSSLGAAGRRGFLGPFLSLESRKLSLTS